MRSTRRAGLAAGVLAMIAGGVLAAPNLGQGDAPTRQIRIAASDMSTAAASTLNAKHVVDYGSFVWAEVSLAEYQRLQASGLAFESVPNAGFQLDLGGVKFDPINGLPQFDAGWGAERMNAGADLRLVQFKAPPKQQWLDDMQAAGLEIVSYVHPHTYIVWGGENARAGFANHEQVRWTGPFVPAFRVQPQWRDLGRAGQVMVDVLIAKGADADEVVREIAELGGKVDQANGVTKALSVAAVMIDGAKINDLATLPGVYSVQPEPTDGGLRNEMMAQVNVNNVDSSNAAFPGYQAYLASVGLDGSGVIIANVDSGISDGHPDLTNRLIPCVGSSCGGGGSSTHGSHTAGIMAGDASSGTQDSFGFFRGQGVAPGASLVEQLYSPTFTQAGGMSELMEQSWENGASLSGNSWGPAGSPRGYDNDTLQVDVSVRDAEPDVAGNQEFTYVLSFMNGNGGTSTQGSPDEGKNLFNIGSTKAQNSSGSQILDINDLSSNTAHGPALDGRTIPHMVAPGCQVDSTASGSGYTLLCGTSMASPQVSGGVALFIEMMRNRPDYTADPSPAMIKAAFTAAARSLAGNLDADGGVLGQPFDSKQGWGRMDLQAVIEANPLSTRYFDQEVLLDNTGDEWSVTVSAFDPAEPVRIMLVWTDAPGHGTGGSTPAWNNNLDLIVESGGAQYFGNNIGASGFSDAGGSADAINNTEGVFLPAGTGGATIRVRATDINSDGVPSVGDTTDQDFALVCYNCAEEPTFLLAADDLTIDECLPASQAINVDVNGVLGFSDAVTLSVNGLPAGASASFSQNPVVPGGSTTVTVDLTNAVATGEYAFAIEGVSGSDSKSLNGSIAAFNGAPAAPGLIAPASGTTGAGLAPTLDWDDQFVSSYRVQLAASPSFAAPIVDSTVADSSFAVMAGLDPETTYYWRVRATNPCGDGAWSGASSFTTRDLPPILVIDDDDNSPNVFSDYDAAFMSMGLTYDSWDTNNTDNEPVLADLAGYEAVVWFTGDEFGGSAGPSGASEAELAAYLDQGGCLFISSQDYLYDRNQTAFMQDYLGVGSHDDDESQTSATGANAFAGVGSVALSYPFTNWSDIVTPGNGGELAFDGSVGNVGTMKTGENWLGVFLAFPVEAMPVGDRAATLQAFLDECENVTPAPSCPADVTGDGTIDVLDLNRVLGSFNQPVAADPDADVNGDGTIDVLDLNEVLALFNTAC